ncbi:MAG: molecular chaperone HtpG [Chloroflexi bacterium]|nr:molecular chaperone HtpG [Chloroflexota bacterium]
MSEQFAFKAEIQQLLNILIHSLYTDREIFLRELISNASDALNRAQFESLTNANMVDAGVEPRIHLKADSDAGTLTISDTGIGMTHDDLVDNLGVIAHSGAKSFIEMLKASQNSSGAAIQELIGQFGVGFYSVFMVADKVRVVTRSARQDDQAWVWESTGGDTFTIEPGERAGRGTDVIVHLKEDAKEFLQDRTLRDIVRRHSNYITFPITIGDDTAPANKQTAIWRQEPKEVTEEQYNEFYKMHTLDFEEPLHRITMRADVPFQFYALLYVPTNAERTILSRRSEPGLALYARKVLIQEYHKDLLPEYLGFIQGVVDSEDLPLNVSRESVQANRIMANLKKSLTNKVLSELKRLSENKADVYQKVFGQFGRLIKQGLVASPDDRDQILPLLRFPSTHSADPEVWTSLADYVSRMATNQIDIYYVLGDDFHSASRSPHLDSFRKRGIEVLFLVDPVDPFMLMGLNEFEGHTLRSADDADIDLRGIGEVKDEERDEEKPEPLPEVEFTTLRDRFAQVLGERVTDVRESKSLVDSPARLVGSGSAPQRNMYRINRLINQDYDLPVKMLELNPRHALVRNLSSMLAHDASNPLIDVVVEQVFETALLQEGLHPDPASMADRLYQLMRAATDRSGDNG